MDTASIFSSTKRINELFGEFISSYPLVKLEVKDEDTAYFQKAGHVGPLHWVLYYHYAFEDFNEVFSYNFTERQTLFVREFYKDKMYLFSVSYRSSEFLHSLFRDFRLFLLNGDESLITTVVLCDEDEEIYLLSDV